jgi:hypothetical protein
MAFHHSGHLQGRCRRFRFRPFSQESRNLCTHVLDNEAFQVENRKEIVEIVPYPARYEPYLAGYAAHASMIRVMFILVNPHAFLLPALKSSLKKEKLPNLFKRGKLVWPATP